MDETNDKMLLKIREGKILKHMLEHNAIEL